MSVMVTPAGDRTDEVPESAQSTPQREHTLTEASGRLNEATQLWSVHIGTAQAQMIEATEHLLQGFSIILDRLRDQPAG